MEATCPKGSTRHPPRYRFSPGAHRSSIDATVHVPTYIGVHLYICMYICVYVCVCTRACRKRKGQRFEKKNCEGRALTLEQVPVLVERSQSLCLIRLLFEVEHLGSSFQSGLPFYGPSASVVSPLAPTKYLVSLHLPQ